MEKIIFQFSETSNQPMTKAGELTHHFYAGNPYWTQEGEPLDLQNFTRSEAIDILRKELGIGYSITGDIITVSNPHQHLQTIMRHLQSVATSCLTSSFPLGWWKMEVCGYGGILISLGDELMTLNEFMLYAISKFSEGITTFYIGSIFEYCDWFKNEAIMDVNNFLEQLHNDTRPKPKLVSNNDMMNIIHSWLNKLTKQAVAFLNPKGKPPRTKINYLGHMFAKAGIPKDVAYQYVKERYFKTGMDEEAFTKEFEDEYDKTGMDLEWIQRTFKKN